MIKKIVDNFLTKKNIFIIYRMGHAIGDQLLLTGLVKEIYKKYKYKIIVFNHRKEIFYNNIYIYKNYRFNYASIISKLLFKVFEYIKFDRIKNLSSGIKDKDGLFSLKDYQDLKLIQYHSLNLKLNINFENFKPEIFFSEKEVSLFEKKFILPESFAIIQANGKTSYTPNKEWGFEKFQNVINATKHIHWIQVSGPKEKKLENVLESYDDVSIRELFYIISKSKFVLCLEGLINHISASFEKKTFLILSGFINENHIKYKSNIIIQNYKNLLCAPCYKLFPCDIVGKPCTNSISAQDVVLKINENI